MSQNWLIIFEWIFGFVASDFVLLTFVLVMFSGSPSFLNNLSPIQKIAFKFQGLFLIAIPGIFLLSFIARFFNKSIAWNHVVGINGIVGTLFCLIFVSAFSIKNKKQKAL